MQAISRGITKAGVAVDMLNLETENLDTVAKAISSGNGFIIGECWGVKAIGQCWRWKSPEGQQPACS